MEEAVDYGRERLRRELELSDKFTAVGVCALTLAPPLIELGRVNEAWEVLEQGRGRGVDRGPKLHALDSSARDGDEGFIQEQMKIGLSNETATAFGLTVRWATSRIVRNVPSVPFTRRCVVVVVVKLCPLPLSLMANVSCPSCVA